MKINENLFLIAPQNKIFKLLEKHNDQRITIITSNSSLKSFEEKKINCYFLWKYGQFSIQRLRFNNFWWLENEIFETFKTSTNYIIIIKINNHDFLKQIVKNYLQQFHLLFEKDDEQELINEAL